MKSVSLMAACALLLGGCAFRPDLHNIALDHNELVASTTNEMTLLNVLRARDRMPMHFTSFTALRGGVAASMATKVGLSLPTDGLTTMLNADRVATGFTKTKIVDTATPAFESSFSTNPNFEMAVHSNEKFQRGIMQPAKAELIDHFLQSGWPDDLIAATFFERIDFLVSKDPCSTFTKKELMVQPQCNSSRNSTKWKYKEGDRIDSLRNEPQSSSGGHFYEFVREHTLEARSSIAKPTILFALEDVKANLKLSDIALLDGKTFDIQVGKDETPSSIVRKSPSVQTFAFEDKSDSSHSGYPLSYGGQLFHEIPKDDGNAKRQSIRKFSISFALENATSIKPADETPQLYVLKDGVYYPVQMRATARSVQAIIYFVGEYIRSEGPQKAQLLRNGNALFQLHDKRPAVVAMTAHHGGHAYFAENECPYQQKARADQRGCNPKTRTLQVVDLIQQLLNLHKSADDLPSARSFTLVP